MEAPAGLDEFDAFCRMCPSCSVIRVQRDATDSTNLWGCVFSSEELEAACFLVFFVASNAAESKSTIRAAVVGIVAANVAKVSRRKRGARGFDGQVSGDVLRVAFVMLLVQRDSQTLHRWRLESLRLGR